MTDTPITYAAAGVDVEAGDKAVELMKESVRRATRPEVLGGLGGFAGLFDASALARMTRPILATSTDGVGTKVAIAQALDRHDTIGFDLVGMVVDDIVVCGAEPLFMTDYIACGKVVPERIAAMAVQTPATPPPATTRSYSTGSSFRTMPSSLSRKAASSSLPLGGANVASLVR